MFTESECWFISWCACASRPPTNFQGSTNFTNTLGFTPSGPCGRANPGISWSGQDIQDQFPTTALCAGSGCQSQLQDVTRSPSWLKIVDHGYGWYSYRTQEVIRISQDHLVNDHCSINVTSDGSRRQGEVTTKHSCHDTSFVFFNGGLSSLTIQ